MWLTGCCRAQKRRWPSKRDQRLLPSPLRLTDNRSPRQRVNRAKLPHYSLGTHRLGHAYQWKEFLFLGPCGSTHRLQRPCLLAQLQIPLLIACSAWTHSYSAKVHHRHFQHQIHWRRKLFSRCKASEAACLLRSIGEGWMVGGGVSVGYIYQRGWECAGWFWYGEGVGSSGLGGGVEDWRARGT